MFYHDVSPIRALGGCIVNIGDLSREYGKYTIIGDTLCITLARFYIDAFMETASVFTDITETAGVIVAIFRCLEEIT